MTLKNNHLIVETEERNVNGEREGRTGLQYPVSGHRGGQQGDDDEVLAGRQGRGVRGGGPAGGAAQSRLGSPIGGRPWTVGFYERSVRPRAQPPWQVCGLMVEEPFVISKVRFYQIVAVGLRHFHNERPNIYQCTRRHYFDFSDSQATAILSKKLIKIYRSLRTIQKHCHEDSKIRLKHLIYFINSHFENKIMICFNRVFIFYKINKTLILRRFFFEIQYTITL